MKTHARDLLSSFVEDYIETPCSTSKSRVSEADIPVAWDVAAVEPFTEDELQEAVRQLKCGKCKDTAGIIAEMIKAGGKPLEHVLLAMYNSILEDPRKAPAKWKESIVTVIFKAGDPKLPSNYRPITIIQILYNLFAWLLLALLRN